MTGRTDSTDDFAGAFDFGRTVAGVPESLSTWRLTTAHADVAKAVATALGGVLANRDETRLWEVVTGTSAVRVILDAAEPVTLHMEHRKSGGVIDCCEGKRFLPSAPSAGDLCGCPQTVAERRALAVEGSGASPLSRVRFRLADLPSVGEFVFESRAWDMAELAEEISSQLSSSCTFVLGELMVDESQFSTPAGLSVTYRRPVLSVALSAESIGGAAVELPPLAAANLSRAA